MRKIGISLRPLIKGMNLISIKEKKIFQETHPRVLEGGLLRTFKNRKV